MTGYRDHWYATRDGLRLYARDYAHPSPRATVLCMHGLSRNSADFEDLCPVLARDCRVIAVDQRGRGRSQYDPHPANYQPGTYVQDMFELLSGLGIGEVIAVGTSMGGLMTMIMAALRPGLLRGAVLNDIGPVIEREGLERIKSYVGKVAPPTDWQDAVAIQRRINGAAFPDFADADWQRFVRRTFREGPAGLPVPAYDPAIAQAMDSAAPPDLWPAFEALGGVPTLVIRGELSDILSAACVAAMRERKPDLVSAEIPRRGHAPMLDEPESLTAIRGFFAGVL